MYEQMTEYIIQSQLEEYLENNSILCDEQSGCRNNNSRETVLNLVIDDWKEDIDNNLYIVAVFYIFRELLKQYI